MAQEVQRQIEQEVSTKPVEPETPKRRPGRPPGATNKPKPPPIDRSASEAEKIAAKAKEDEKNKKRDTPNPPDFGEWRDFLGEVVLHWFSVAFIAVAFRGIPYHDMLTDEEFEDIQLDDDELKAVARPFAHLVAHSKLNGKYGRAIMNSRDSIEAAVVLFMWGARVNRIAKKHKTAYKLWIESQENGISRIPRVDSATNSAEEIVSESPQPVIGIQKAAFGHGFN